MNPRVSIIIPCKEIGDYARESIEHCLKLDYPDFAILVLPDAESTLNLLGVRIIPTGPVGPAEKRDLAASRADSEFLAFIDDDAYPDKLWLKKAMRHFQDTDIAAVGGPGITPETDGLRQKASGLVLSSRIGSGSNSFRNTPGRQMEIDDCPSCNFIIRKSVFQQVGGFDTHFWPGEDTKLCLEVTNKLHKKIIYDPEVLVYHHRRKLFKAHLKQVWNYALHRGYFAKKLPRTSRRLLYFLPSIFLLGTIFGIIASLLNPVLKLVFLSVLALYLLLTLITSFESKSVKMAPLVFLGVIATHLTYGAGFLKGLFAREVAR